MLRKTFVALLLAAIALTFCPVPQAKANDADASSKLLGNWKLTSRPADAAGTPCPFLPDTITFQKGHNLIMSNMPGRLLPYKTDLSAAERTSIEARSSFFKGKNLLLVKPAPQMEWLTTPMVYGYTASKDGLILLTEGWDPATFKRVK
jgi:hypothetical protein